MCKSQISMKLGLMIVYPYDINISKYIRVVKCYLYRFGFADVKVCIRDGLSAQNELHLLFDCHLPNKRRYKKMVCKLYEFVWELSDLLDILKVDEFEFSRFVMRIVQMVIDFNVWCVSSALFMTCRPLIGIPLF